MRVEAKICGVTPPDDDAHALFLKAMLALLETQAVEVESRAQGAAPDLSSTTNFACAASISSRAGMSQGVKPLPSSNRRAAASASRSARSPTRRS